MKKIFSTPINPKKYSCYGLKKQKKHSRKGKLNEKNFFHAN